MAQIIHEDLLIHGVRLACFIDCMVAPDRAADASHLVLDEHADRAWPQAHHLIHRMPAFQFHHLTQVADLVCCRLHYRDLGRTTLRGRKLNAFRQKSRPSCSSAKSLSLEGPKTPLSSKRERKSA
jgi:hypothetical protein